MPAIRTRPAPIDVTTSVLAAPSVAIVSPTPLAFTFSSSTAPFGSRSSSPANGLKLTIPATPEHGPRTLTPVSPASSSSPTFSSPSSSVPPSPARQRAATMVGSLTRSPSPMPSSSDAAPMDATTPIAAPSFKRRKSTGGVQEPAETAGSSVGPIRRPKKGDEDYIKRPENAFILFRRKCVEDRVQAQEAEAAAATTADAEAAAPASKVKKARQADLSKMISQQWRTLSAEKRTYWENLAKERKREHEIAHPDYVYRPQRTKKANATKSNPKKGKGRADPEPEPAPESVSFVLPLPPSPTSRHGRSSSTPNAQRFGPTTQMIRLPVVQMPALPVSPLDPMAAHWPRTAEPPFDPAGMPFQPQQSFEPPVFYQGMWTTSDMQAPTLPPLFMPSQPGMYSSGPSPAETASPATPYPGFAPVAAVHNASNGPQMWIGEPSDVTMVPFDLEAELPSLCDIPWTHEFVGEFVPGGLLSDGDFDLAAIAPATLDELCERKGGAWDLSALDLGAGAAPLTANGQDPLDFFLADTASAGRY